MLIQPYAKKLFTGENFSQRRCISKPCKISRLRVRVCLPFCITIAEVLYLIYQINVSKRKGIVFFFFNHIVPIIHIYWILLIAYRDNGRISFASSTAKEFFENYNYDCVGNEAILRECPYNYKSCPSSPTIGRSRRTNLNCTGKNNLVLDNGLFI